LALLLDLNNQEGNNEDDHNLVWFVTTHLGADVLLLEQAGQAIELIQFLSRLQSNRIILCGDFNSFWPSPSIMTISNNLDDAWSIYPNRPNKGLTFPSIFPCIRLDYFFIHKEFVSSVEIIEMEVINNRSSDHRPLYMEIQIKN